MTLTNETTYSSTEQTETVAKLAPKTDYIDIGPKPMLDQLVVRPGSARPISQQNFASGST